MNVATVYSTLSCMVCKFTWQYHKPRAGLQDNPLSVSFITPWQHITGIAFLVLCTTIGDGFGHGAFSFLFPFPFPFPFHLVVPLLMKCDEKKLIVCSEEAQ